MQSFSELALSPAVSKAIAEMGFEKPSDIQAQALPKLLQAEATDFIGLAATGTGKTAAFAIPLVERLSAGRGPVQSIILCPTRELALQVAGQVDLIGKYKNIRTLAIYGGAGYQDQFDGLRARPSVVVGTPGRVIDHLKRGSLMLDKVHTVILDEADEMISMGFKDEIDEILAFVSGEKTSLPVVDQNDDAEVERTAKIWLFSATMSKEVRSVANRFLKNPEQVQINRTEMLSSTVEQYFYPTQERNKPDILCKLIDAAEDFYGIVFCQTKSLVTDLQQYMIDRGYKVDSLHGDKNQSQRERTMQLFRDKKVNVLICTDVAARGIDVKDITHVINYSLPRELENYVHRIGRTARSGKKGVAMSLVTPAHRSIMFRIEGMTKTKMKEGRIPTRREIAAKKVSALIPKFKEQDSNALRALEVMGEEWKDMVSAMSPAEVAARFLAFLNQEIFEDQAADRVANSLPGPAPRTEQRFDSNDEARPRGAAARPAFRRDAGREAGRERFDRARGPEGAPRADRPRVRADGPRVRDEGPRVRAEGPRPRPEGFDRPRPQTDGEGFDRPRPQTDGEGFDRPRPRAEGERFGGPRFERPERSPEERKRIPFHRENRIPRNEDARPAAPRPVPSPAPRTEAPAFEAAEADSGEPKLNRKQRRDLARAQGLIKPIFNEPGDDGPRAWSDKAPRKSQNSQAATAP